MQQKTIDLENGLFAPIMISPADQPAYTGQVLLRNIDVYNPASPGTQTLSFGEGQSPKWIIISYRVTSQGASPSVGNFIKVALNAYTPYDAAGKMSSDANVFTLTDKDDIIVAGDARGPITRIDIGTDVARGTETSLVSIYMGF